MDSIIDAPVPTKTFVKQISTTEYNSQKDDYTKKALKELQEQMKTFKTPKEKKEEKKEERKGNYESNKYIYDDNDNDDNDDNDGDDCDDNENCGNNNDNISLDSESDYDTKEKPSLIIKHIIDSCSNGNNNKTETITKKRKTNNSNKTSNSSSNTSSNLHDAIYAQHELDIKTITKLNNRIKELEKENGEFESKIHYLRLDVVNTICERNELQKEVKTLYIENEKNIKQAVIIVDHDKKNRFYFNILKYVVIILMMMNIYIPAAKYFLMVFSFGLLVI